MRADFLGQNLEIGRTSNFSQWILKPENNEKLSVFLSRLGTDESSFPKRSLAAIWPHSFRDLCELHMYENGLFFFFHSHSKTASASRSSNWSAVTEL